MTDCFTFADLAVCLRRRGKTVCKLVLIGVLVLYFLRVGLGGGWRLINQATREREVSGRKSGNITGEELLDIVENRLVYSESGSSVKALEQVLKLLQSRIGEKSNSNTTTSRPTNNPTHDVHEATSQSDVCPEVYSRRDDDWYEKNWKFETCQSVKPISSILTVLVNAVHYTQSQMVTLLKQIREHYPTLKIVVAVDRSNMTILTQKDVEFVVSNNENDWTKILHTVNTKYTLLLPTVNRFTNYANIERLVSVASRFNIPFVGGASVGLNGHWWHGCHQVSLRNYRLRYVYGYEKSRDSCLFCDHIDGPFLALTKVLQQRMSNIKQDKNVFENLFLSMKADKIQTAVCPDVMFHVEAIGLERQFAKEKWVSLAAQHKLNEIITYSNQSFVFTCADVNMICPGIDSSRGRLIPPCCLNQIRTCSYVMFNVAERANITLEVTKGTLLCALKMRTDCPWDLDLDSGILESKKSLLRSLTEKDPSWTASGCKFVIEDSVLRAKAIDKRHFNAWHVGFVFTKQEASVHYSRLGYNYTSVLYGGRWVRAPPNPGLNARGIYVNEIYQHAEHYTHSPKLKRIRKEYNPSKQPFLKCRHPDKHYCLDQFTRDGSVQFENN